MQAGVNQPQSCGSLITDQKGKATKERDTERQSERKKERRDYTVGGEVLLQYTHFVSGTDCIVLWKGIWAAAPAHLQHDSYPPIFRLSPLMMNLR